MKKNTVNVVQANKIRAVKKTNTKQDSTIQAHSEELTRLFELADSFGRRLIAIENAKLAIRHELLEERVTNIELQPKESLLKAIIITTIGATLGVLLAMGILEYFK